MVRHPGGLQSWNQVFEIGQVVRVERVDAANICLLYTSRCGEETGLATGGVGGLAAAGRSFLKADFEIQPNVRCSRFLLGLRGLLLGSRGFCLFFTVDRNQLLIRRAYQPETCLLYTSRCV